MPKLSIIVPVYDVEKYLNECMESLRNQTLKEIEIIMVDDESPDNCPIICDRFAELDSRVRVIHKKNGGLGFARNSGLEVATGEYVTFVDSDDYVDSDTYLYLLDKYYEENPDVIYYKYIRFDTGGIVKASKKQNGRIYEGESIKDLMLDIIAPAVTVKRERVIECSSCTSIYKRAFLENNKIRFHSERQLISEDMIFNLDVLSVANKVCYNESLLYFYRKNDNSLTGKVNTNKPERIFVFSDYLLNNIEGWCLPVQETSMRIARMTIGKIRNSIVSVLTSKEHKKVKRDFFKKIVSADSFRQLIMTYPVNHYSIYQKLFLLSMKHKSYLLASVLSVIKSKIA